MWVQRHGRCLPTTGTCPEERSQCANRSPATTPLPTPLPTALSTQPSAALRTYAALAAVLGWTALGTQLWLTMGIVLGQGRGLAMGLVIYLGFFTVLTNMLAALVLSAGAMGPALTGYRWLSSALTRTTTAGAISIVGLVYFAILRHSWHPEGLQLWTDAALHYLMPTLVVVFWALVVPAGAISWRRVPWLAMYPLAYLVYVFLRGSITSLYPYDFIDVNKLGMGQAMLNSAAVMLAYSLVIALLMGLKAWRARSGQAGRPV